MADHPETEGAGPVLPGELKAGEMDPGGIDVVGIVAARAARGVIAQGGEGRRGVMFFSKQPYAQ